MFIQVMAALYDIGIWISEYCEDYGTYIWQYNMNKSNIFIPWSFEFSRDWMIEIYIEIEILLVGPNSWIEIF